MNILLLPKQVKLSAEEIMYLESDSNYTFVYQRGKGKKMLVALSLCKIQSSLDTQKFVRINRANLINTDFIKNYEVTKEFINLTLRNGKKFKTSRRRMETVLSAITTKK